MSGYGEQPERQVANITPDEIDPSFSQVHYNDGTMETMPTSQAQALPAEPPPLTPADLAATNPAPPPAGDPVAAPNALAQQWAAAGQDPLVAAAEAGTAPPGYVAPEGRPTNPGVAANRPGGETLTTAPRTDPMAEVVDPGSPGGFADFSKSQSESVQNSETVDDAGVMQGRVDEAAGEEAGAARLRDQMAYSSRRDSLDSELDARDQQEAAQRQQLRQAELEKAEHEKIYKAIEATPVDEDEFWSGSPGRTAGAWIALALSGFLQGATRGQNPALNQMVQALNHAQDRYVQNQQKNRDSQLRTRERLMGSSQNAVDTLKLQLSGMVEKRIQLEAQREGLQPPPALSTYLAQGAVKRAEAKNAIGARVAHTATIASQEEQRATPGTGPLRRGDVVLKNLLGPEYQKKHAEAMDPKGLNLGGMVQGAARLDTVAQALAAISKQYGGSLPSQETVSLSRIPGLAPLAARLGFDRGKDEISVKQLLEEAKLAYKQTVNIKSIDSENEGKNFNAIIDSGEGVSTLEAIRTRAAMANEQAVSVASGVTRDTQGYLDFVRQTQGAVPGVQSSPGGVPIKSDTGYRVPAGRGPTEEQTVRDAAPAPTSQGGSAPRPLAASRRESPRVFQSADPADLGGYSAEALDRIVGFESGGRPDARNAQSGATGLIQWMPDVYRGMAKPPGYEGVRFEDLPSLTAEEQLPLVVQYFRERGVPADADAGEMYLAVAAPAALGKPDDTVVYRAGSKAWEQNPAWRPAGGGDITAGDIRAKGRSL